MGKNDVEIAIRAHDAVGPGVDSARRSLSQFQKEIEKSSRSASLADDAIKFAAAVNGIRGAVEISSAAIHLFKGNTAEAGEALRRLPLGIGGVIGAIQDLNKAAADSPAITKLEAGMSDLFRKRLRAEEEARRVGNQGLLADLDKERDLQQKAQEDAADAKSKAFADNKQRNDAAYRDAIDEIDRTLAAQIDASNKRVELARKANDEKNRKLIEADIKAAREAAEKSAEAEEKVKQESLRRDIARAGSDQSNPLAVARLKAEADADAEAFDKARDQVRKMKGGGLPSGESSRFLTGLAAAAQTEEQKQTSALEKMLKTMEQVEKNTKEGAAVTQLNIVGSGIFGGLS